MPPTKASPSSADNAAPSPAQLAKAALRHLAENRLEPTPDNYRKAYEAESGVTSSPEDKPAPKDTAQPSPSPSDEGERWSELIKRMLKGAERGGRQWTTARKKDSLQRVLEGSKSSATRLHQRLTQLVASWDSDTLDSSLLEGENLPIDLPRDSNMAPLDTRPAPLDAITSDQSWPPLAGHAVEALRQVVLVALPNDLPPATEAAEALGASLQDGQSGALSQPEQALVRDQISDACEQARRIIEHRHHLIAQLTELCTSLTDSLVDLTEDDSWVQGQCQAMRHQLSDGLHSRGVRHMQQLLADTRERQIQLKQEREAARQALKQLIHQMLQEVVELGFTTDRFQSNLGRYADTIGQAESLESLTDVVREMVEESRAMQATVAQSQSRMQQEHTRATELSDKVRELEDQIRKLSDEVSTDPLTQIANRRGMMRAFEAEQARVERTGTTLAIGLLDVDNFKKLNDQMGHQTGDEALKFLARRVSECLRPVDVVARYGGEEFVVMLPDTPVDEAQQILTRLQRTLSAEFFTHEDKKVFITFSAGVTLYRKGEPIEASLERADVALYEAKRTGKNRTCMG
jgi:diguanylate cyclase